MNSTPGQVLVRRLAAAMGETGRMFSAIRAKQFRGLLVDSSEEVEQVLAELADFAGTFEGSVEIRPEVTMSTLSLAVALVNIMAAHVVSTFSYANSQLCKLDNSAERFFELQPAQHKKLVAVAKLFGQLLVADQQHRFILVLHLRKMGSTLRRFCELQPGLARDLAVDLDSLRSLAI